jgi:hypothetical protein
VSAVWKSKKKQMLVRLKETDIGILRSTVEMARDSVVFGNAEYGSPGQPEDLRDKWKITYGKGFARLFVNEKSARSVEEGISQKYGGPITLKSDIGGFHSVKQTKKSIRKILAKAAAANTNQGPL